MNPDRSSSASVFVVAIVAILGVALLAFVTVSFLNQQQGNDGGGIPLPTISIPTPAPEEPQSSWVAPLVAWTSSAAA